MACRSQACAHWEAQADRLGVGLASSSSSSTANRLVLQFEEEDSPIHAIPHTSSARYSVTAPRSIWIPRPSNASSACWARGSGPSEGSRGSGWWTCRVPCWTPQGRGVRGPRSKEGGCFCLPRLTSARSLPPTMAAMERPPPPSPLLLPPSPDCCAVPATDNGSNGVPPPSPSLLPLPASHLTAARSLLPTMAAMERSPGSLRAPGAGWVTSAPKIMKWSMLPSCAGGCGGG